MTSHVAFVTEGSAGVGLGHVSRCLAVARAARNRGARVTFIATPEPAVAALLAAERVEVIECPWTADPDRAVAALRALAAAAIVVDSYKASSDFLAALRTVGSLVLAVDDTAERELPVDVVVNGGVAAPSLPYRRNGNTELLLGPRYALLDPAYADAPERRVGDRAERIFVSLGGGVNTGAVAAAIRAADALLDGGDVDVGAGPFEEPGKDLDVAARASRNRVTIHRGRFGLRELMGAADLAVTGAGMTLYELSAMRTPAVTVCMADNQAPNAEGFARAGAALPAGRAGADGLGLAIEHSLRRLTEDPVLRAEIARRARQLVDGRGASRVAARLLGQAVEPG